MKIPEAQQSGTFCCRTDDQHNHRNFRFSQEQRQRGLQKKLPMVSDQKGNCPPSPCFIGEEIPGITTSSVPLRRRRRRQHNRFVSSRKAGIVLSQSQSRQDDDDCGNHRSGHSTALLSTLQLALDVGCFPFPELLVAPDDNEEVLKEACRRDLLKDDMIMFYRQLYKLQMKDHDLTLSSPCDGASSSGSIHHVENGRMNDPRNGERGALEN